MTSDRDIVIKSGVESLEQIPGKDAKQQMSNIKTSYDTLSKDVGSFLSVLNEINGIFSRLDENKSWETDGGTITKGILSGYCESIATQIDNIEKAVNIVNQDKVIKRVEESTEINTIKDKIFKTISGTINERSEAPSESTGGES